MKSMFENVQSQFMGLSTLFSGLDFDKEIRNVELIAKINDALSETYVLLNQGFCESISMCEKCTSNRDQLRDLMQIIDACEGSHALNAEACSALRNFADNIPSILNKMESVYLQNYKILHKI